MSINKNTLKGKNNYLFNKNKGRIITKSQIII